MTIHVCFHGVGTCRVEREPGEAQYWVTADMFRHVLDRVRGRDDVRLSFDDGNVSDREIAVPELRERGLTATFFALAGRLDDPASLSAADLRQLRVDGMDVGSHGWSHQPWRALNMADSRREFVEARFTLAEASGGAIEEAALPLGRYDRATLAGLRAVGYTHVYSSDRYRARQGAWLQARYSVTATDTRESIERILRPRSGVAELRNVAASAVKRRR